MILQKKKVKRTSSTQSTSVSVSKTTTKKKGKEETHVVVKKRSKKEGEEVEEVWEWWKEDKKPEGIKWNTLTHMGPLFAPPYEPLPENVKFLYDGKVIRFTFAYIILYRFSQ